jgi:hypothetical protein
MVWMRFQRAKIKTFESGFGHPMAVAGFCRPSGTGRE